MPGTVTGMAGRLGSAGIVHWGSRLWPLQRSWTSVVTAQAPRAGVLEVAVCQCLWAGPEARSVAPSPVLSLLIVAKHSAQWGFPAGCSGEEPACQYRTHKGLGLCPRFGKIPWRRSWQAAPVFLPGESQGPGALVSYSPWRRKRVGHDWSDLAGTHVECSSYQAVLTIYKCQSSSLDGAYSVA